MNQKNVLLCIKRNDGISRAEIAKVLSLSKPTTSKLVQELIDEGWVYEEWREEVNSLGGRRPLSLFFNEKSKYIFGIDIGGTNVEVALVSLTGKVIEKTTFSTQQHLGVQLIEKLVDSLYKLMKKQNLSDSKILGIGIGVPGITDFEKGIVIDAPTLGWCNYPLRQVLEEKLSYPIYIDNDVNVSVIGEKWQGAAKNKRNILKVMLGTGIGCGMILENELYRGASYAAGEVGYMVTDQSALNKGYTSMFAGYGFLDNHVGGPAIASQMNKHLSKENEVTARQVFELAREHHPQAEKIVQDMIEHLSFALMNMIAVVNPQCIVIGGGIAKSLPPYLPRIQATIEKYIPIACEILFSEQEDMSVLGAAYLLLTEHDSIFNVNE